MTAEELVHKIGELEWEDFEVKEAKAQLPKSSWATVSAFANTRGGWLLYGIRQNGKQFEIQGVKNVEKLEQDFLSTLRGEKFNVFVETKQILHTIDNKKILGFYIPASPKKPVYFNSPKNTFIRRGSADQRATREEIDTMYRDQTFGTKSSELAQGTSTNDIKEKSVEEYTTYMARFNPEVSYNRMDTVDFLSKMRILDSETGQCTYGGLLFFGKRDTVERFFADFRIDLFEISGTSYEDASSRYHFRLSEDDYENLWELYFECFKRLRKEIDIKFKLSQEGFGEELSPGLKAVREALVNMLMHADYFSPGHPRVRIFTDHIEFFNPGGLPKPLEEIRSNDLSIPRNPILAKLFRMVKLAENAGYGIDKMESNWLSYNGTIPVFATNFDSTMVTLVTQKEGNGRGTSAKLQVNFSETSEELKLLLQKEEMDINLITSIMHEEFELFLDYLSKNFRRTSEELPKNFRRTPEELQKNFRKNHLKFLMLVAVDNRITAKKAAEILGVSDRTITTYISKLKDEGLLIRIGSTKGGYWQIIN